MSQDGPFAMIGMRSVSLPPKSIMFSAVRQHARYLFPCDSDVINWPPPEAANPSRAEPVTIPPSRPVLTPSRRRFVLSPATPAAAALVLGPWYDVMRANAVKAATEQPLTFAALIVFQASSLIEWIPGLVLGIGNMIGAWLGTHVAVNKGTNWVRWFVIVVVLVSAAQLLGVFQWVGSLLG